MAKKIVALALAIVLFVSGLPLSIFAADTSGDDTGIEATLIYVESTHARPGEYVDVNINIINNPGIAGAKFGISFDENLTLTSIKEEGVFSELDFTAPENLTGTVLFTWDSLDAVSSMDGTILTLTFKVAESATANEYLDIDISHDNGDIYNTELNSLTVVTVDGRLLVIDYIPGDVNSDGAVNGKDVTLLRRYNAGIAVEINLLAADVNDDGAINGKDVTLVRRSNAGWDVTLIPSTPNCNHAMTEYEAKEATCTEAGNVAYWSCSKCDKYFMDADATIEMTLAETVITEKGHTEVKDEAVAPTYNSTGLTEGYHCSVCNIVLVEQQVISALNPEYYSITYSNLLGATYPDLNEYVSHIGVKDTDMPKPERKGYEFEGWYTDNEFAAGTKITDIPAGTKEHYHLYAKWSAPIEYKITYKDAPIKNNPETYNVEETVVLEKPKWNGLSFAFWTDESGNVITKIDKGTTGAITLTAHWRTVQNLAIPSNSDSFDVFYDDTYEQYHFIYELGTINNIVLNTHFQQKMDGTQSYSFKHTDTVNVEESVATSTSQTLVESLLQTDSWYELTEDIEEHSNTTKNEFTLCPEIEVEGVKAKVWEYTNGTTKFDRDSFTKTEYSGEFYETDQEDATTISSNLFYVKETGTAVEHTIDLHPDYSPIGMYNYVYAGDVRVYAIVTYDPATGNYYLDTYSIMYRTYTATVYELLPEYDLDVNIEPNEIFTFDIPYGEMTTYIESSYYVQYDANGGSGTMPMSTFACDKVQSLPANKFTKAGYTFGGWKLEGKDLPINDEGMVTNLAAKGKTITLSAIWTPIRYAVTWAPASNLSIVVERTSSPNVGASTGKLLSGDTIYYGDILKVTYTPSTGYTIASKGSESITVTGNVTSSLIYAKANPCNYTVTYNYNGGSGSSTSKTVTYNSNYGTLVTPTRTDYAFTGWYLNGTKITSDSVVTTAGSHSLTAGWTRIKTSLGFTKPANSTKRAHLPAGASHTDTFATNFDKASLTGMGYKTLTLEIKFECDRTNWICYNEAKIQILGANGKVLYEYEYPDVFGWDTTTKTITTTINIADLDGSCSFKIVWSTPDDGNSASDGWNLGDTSVTITAKK